jgi:Ni,Fe-hydrogenase I cytochrome b subunit
MDPIRLFSIISWISLPTVMFGGYSLLRLITRENNPLTPFQETYFRAGHAHAGVLLLLSLLYYNYLARTTFSDSLKWVACVVLVIGILAQSGGFFLHMGVGKPGRISAGTVVTSVGALLLALVVLLLVYGLITA